MSKHRLSLLDVLNPPANPWLKEISKPNAKVPVGVRVVRLNDDDDIRDQSQSPRSSGTLASMRQAA